MGLDFRRATLWEYGAALYGWNRNADPDGDEEPVEPPSVDRVVRSFDKMAAILAHKGRVN